MKERLTLTVEEAVGLLDISRALAHELARSLGLGGTGRNSPVVRTPWPTASATSSTASAPTPATGTNSPCEP